jgi:formylglycine-generating enzyme required for sulfatase activity
MKKILINLVFFVFLLFSLYSLPLEIYSESDGKKMVLVSGGVFEMGTNLYKEKKIIEAINDGPSHKVFVDSFYIDATEVTNAEYQMFLEENEDISEPLFWNDLRYNHDYQPVVGITWNEAKSYAEWAGKRLPTEAEWEKASVGKEFTRYPWGDRFDSKKTNWGDGGRSDKSEFTSFVCKYTYDKSTNGCYDMCGNVSEWIEDYYDPIYYINSSKSNPVNKTIKPLVSVRGGNYKTENFLRMRNRYRSGLDPLKRYDFVGFRCVMDK